MSTAAALLPSPAAGPAAGRLPLSQLIAAHAGEEPVPGFTAWLEGEAHEVTAVLERTAVIAESGDRWAGKRTARLDRLEVAPASISWRPRQPAVRLGGRAPSPHSEAARARRRAASDDRARTDQARHRPASAGPAQDGTATPPPATTGAPGQSAPYSEPEKGRPRPIDLAEGEPALEDLPARVQDLMDELLQAWARNEQLEAELVRYRSEARRLRARVDTFLARRAS